MARLPDLVAFGRQHRMPVLTIEDLVHIVNCCQNVQPGASYEIVLSPNFGYALCNLIQGHTILLKVCTKV